MRKYAIASILCLLSQIALSQGIIIDLAQAQTQVLVPTRPAGDNTNAASSTAFVQNALSSGGGLAQSANTVFAGPASGAATAPIFRSLVTADIPSTLAGGSLASSALTIESTAGVGTSDFIQFLTGSQTQRGLIQTDGSFLWSTGTASINVATYDGITNSGKAAWKVTNSDNSSLTGLERYTAWFGNTSQGTGDGSVPATTFSIGCSAVKSNWPSTTVAGQFVCLNVVARGGDNNVLTSGDVAGITANVGASFSNNFVTPFEAVSGFFPGGSTTNSLDINVQAGSIRASGLDNASNTGVGFFTQAQNGAVGRAFSASNRCANPLYGTCGTWQLGFLNYLYDDGTHTPYNAFNVNQLGQLTLAGFGAANTNQKTLRVGSSATNVFGITNAALSVEILSLTDVGALSVVGGFTSGANGGVGGGVTLNGATSSNWGMSVSPTGGHLFWSGGVATTLTAGCNGAGSSISGTDSLGTVVGQTAVATSCTVTWGTAYTLAPRCIPTGRTTPVTSYSTSTTNMILNFASTASAIFDWTCYGA